MDYDNSRDMLDSLIQGAFLTVQNKDEINVMTIGWGSLGYVWGLPCFSILVRHNRHTYSILKETDEFTVSFPDQGDMQSELTFCGSNSGRDMDKFAECDLETKKPVSVNTPVIDGCKHFLECKVIYKQAMDPSKLGDSLKKQWYPNEKYHTIYYGRILEKYEK